VGGRRSKRPGLSPTLGSLGPSHQWRHKSRVSLRGPPCAHGVADTPHGEVRDIFGVELTPLLVRHHCIRQTSKHSHMRNARFPPAPRFLGSHALQCHCWTPDTDFSYKPRSPPLLPIMICRASEHGSCSSPSLQWYDSHVPPLRFIVAETV
jgi:hypothetical protein